MRERPILFSAPMVKAILAGTKTQTRRPLSRRLPVEFVGGAGQQSDLSAWGYWVEDMYGRWAVLERGKDDRYAHGHVSIRCPYGVPGDRAYCAIHGAYNGEYGDHSAERSHPQADPGIPQRRLHGRGRREHLLANTVRGFRAEGPSGLVSDVSAAASQEGIAPAVQISDALSPESQSEQNGSSPSVPGVSWGPSNSILASQASGRGCGELRSFESGMGLSVRELGGPSQAWPCEPGREASRREADGCGAGASSLGADAGSLQRATRGAHARVVAVRGQCNCSCGTVLWVRETWAAPHDCDHLKPRDIPPGTRIHYRASEPGPSGLLWRPSIHMPRQFSRITLELTDVRVQRLQEISEEDARAEGVSMPDGDPRPPEWWSYRQEFFYLWDSINGKRSPWSRNDWVWALTFKRVEE